MVMQTVFRLEDADGLGAFEASSWDVMDAIDAIAPDYVLTRPLPYADGGRLSEAAAAGELTNVRFGTPSVELLQHWFPPAISDLLEQHRTGVEFTVWEVPSEDIYAGEHQVAFKPDRARCLERRPLAELHKE